jgi:hypothetical protein
MYRSTLTRVVLIFVGLVVYFGMASPILEKATSIVSA